MLVLSRQLNETVMVGNKIQVKVLAIHGNRVLLGFKAPLSVTVHREEVYKRLQSQKTNDIRYAETEY